MTGKVKWFDPKKGFGFITRTKPNQQDVFVHYSAILTPGYRSLNQGDSVSFELVNEPKKGLRAEKVIILGKSVETREPQLKRFHD